MHFRLPDTLVELKVILAACVLLCGCSLWRIPTTVKDVSVATLLWAATSANVLIEASIASGDSPEKEV